MYKETITGLRKIVQDYKGRLTPYMRVTIAEAADAIDELSKRSECPCWYGDMRFCSMLGKQFPVPLREKE